MHYIKPDWPIQHAVNALTTTRQGGVSQGTFASNNMGSHVNDVNAHWQYNRAQLTQQLPSAPHWLRQTHSSLVLNLDETTDFKADITEADASFSATSGTVCAVMTADCLPVLVCDIAQGKVAAIHAGWRGLASGIIEKTLAAMQADKNQTYLWLGPAIGPDAFEVGLDVYQCFTQQNAEFAQAFKPSAPTKYLADIYALARMRLQALGYQHIYGGHFCTYQQSDLFYSYRRENTTGRMASLIWLP